MNASITFPIKVPSAANLREHWAVKARRVKEQRHVTALVLRTKEGAALLKAAEQRPLAVTLTRLSPRLLDGDNLQTSLKAVRDEVAKAIGVDDRDGTEDVWWRYTQEKNERQGVRIFVERLSDDMENTEGDKQ